MEAWSPFAPSVGGGFPGLGSFTTGRTGIGGACVSAFSATFAPPASNLAAIPETGVFFEKKGIFNSFRKNYVYFFVGIPSKFGLTSPALMFGSAGTSLPWL